MFERSRRRRPLTLLGVAVLCVSLAACGSRLAPEDAAFAQREAIGGAGGSAPGSAAGGTAPDGSASGGQPAANCAGFRTGPGIDDGHITIANASDVGGALPGQHVSAQQAVQAFVAYFNSTSGICGRKLKLLPLDSRGDVAGDQAAAAEACQHAFAMVGSMSAADVGGAQAVTQCAIPDIRAASTSPERSSSPAVFSARASRVGQIPAALPEHFARQHPDAVQRAGFVFVNTGVTSAVTAQGWIAGYAKRGVTWVYQQSVDVAEFNYAPHVLQMKQNDVRFVQFLGPHQHAVRLAQAMRQQGFAPKVFLLDASAYDQDFVAAGGAAIEGARVFVDTALFEEAADNPEMQLYLKWLGDTMPGARPSYAGLYAWSAARLFTELAIGLGGRLDRQSLMAALAGVGKWDGRGLSVQQDVGGRTTSPCIGIIRLEGGRWVRDTAERFLCGELVDLAAGS